MYMDVALPCTVRRPAAVVDDVRHVMCHVITSRPLLLLIGQVLALFHAQHFRQTLDSDLQMPPRNKLIYQSARQ